MKAIYLSNKEFYALLDKNKELFTYFNQTEKVNNTFPNFTNSYFILDDCMYIKDNEAIDA
jgi:hypothetical protein